MAVLSAQTCFMAPDVILGNGAAPFWDGSGTGRPLQLKCVQLVHLGGASYTLESDQAHILVEALRGFIIPIIKINAESLGENQPYSKHSHEIDKFS